MPLQCMFRSCLMVFKPGLKISTKELSTFLGPNCVNTTSSQLSKHLFGFSKRGHRQCYCTSQQLPRSTFKKQNNLTWVSYSTSASTGGLADQVLKSKIQAEAEQDKKEESSQQTEEEEEKIKQQQNQLRALKFTLYAFGSMFVGGLLYVIFVWGAPMTDHRGNVIKDEFSELSVLTQYIRRAISEMQNYATFLANPTRDRLLPDPLKHPYIQPPYTLLIELTGVLVHPDWTYKTGWRFKKRPGMDYFFSQLAAGYNFEVVIYTAELGYTAFPIIDALDSQGIVMYRLFRDSTKYEGGVHMKEIGKVNRDLSKVIMIDCDEKVVAGYRNNTIVLPRWKGNDDDRTLFDLAALLKTISTSEVQDVRGVLEYYSKYPDPISEFREKQKRLAELENIGNQAAAKAKEAPLIGNPIGPAVNWVYGQFKKQ